MPCGQASILHQALHGRRQEEQSEGVRNRGTTLPDPPGDLLVGQREVVQELLVGRGFFQGIQVLTVEVLHQSLLQRARIVHFPDNGGNHREAGPLRRSPASLPRDQLVGAITGRADQNGL